ncbi:hypothetical protein FCS82_02455 [Oenococcus sp. UCMA 14587]|nr:hypothetical protein [Oenococcus sp. UCMA 14587]
MGITPCPEEIYLITKSNYTTAEYKRIEKIVIYLVNCKKEKLAGLDKGKQQDNSDFFNLQNNQVARLKWKP